MSIHVKIQSRNHGNEENILFDDINQADSFLCEKFPIEDDFFDQTQENSNLQEDVKEPYFIWDEDTYIDCMTKSQNLNLFDPVKCETIETYYISVREVILMNPFVYIIQDLTTGIIINVFKNKKVAADFLRKGEPCLGSFQGQPCKNKSDPYCISCSTVDQVCLERKLQM